MDLSQIIANRKNQEAAQGQNLINQPKIDTSERSAGFYKSIVLDIISVFSAATLGFSYYRYLSHGLSVWVLLAALIWFGAMSVLQVFLAKSGRRRSFIIILEVLAISAFFFEEDWHILAITIPVLLAMLIWGYFSARARLKNSITIPFFGVSGNMLGKYTTGILLFMILSYVPQIGGNALIVSQQSFRTFFDWASGIVNTYYPTLSLNGSFGNFSDSFSKMELQNNPNFQTLNTEQQSIAVEQASDQFATNFAQSSPNTISTSSPTSDAFYNVLDGVLNAWKSQSSGWFDVGWVTVLFIGLRALGFLFVWVGQLITLIVYEILLASGFMKIAEEDRRKEIMTY